MTQDRRDPREVALKYAVKITEKASFELTPLREPLPKIRVQRQGAILNLRAVLKQFCWQAEERTEPFYVVTLEVDDLNIGHRGTEGWSSALVDDCVFVIDGDALKHLALIELRVVSEMQFNLEEANLARIADKEITERQDDGVAGASWPFPSKSNTGQAGSLSANSPDFGDERSSTIARARIIHCPAMDGYCSDERLRGEIGMSDPCFRKLVDACISGSLSSIKIHGIAGALSTSGDFGTPRDLLVLARSGFDFHINTIALEYHI